MSEYFQNNNKTDRNCTRLFYDGLRFLEAEKERKKGNWL